MTIDRIKTDVIYEHEKHGEVLVTGIGKMYEEWSTTGPKDDIESGNVLVYFYYNYDDYGGINPMPLSETVKEFSKSVKNEIREHQYTTVDD